MTVDTPAGPEPAPRQAVVKQPGRSRRAKLMPAPDTDPNPHPPVLREEGGVAPAIGDAKGARSENEARLRQDRPPHW
jgi:high-mobility group nucleosome-binding domain-containing protein 2